MCSMPDGRVGGEVRSDAVSARRKPDTACPRIDYNWIGIPTHILYKRLLIGFLVFVTRGLYYVYGGTKANTCKLSKRFTSKCDVILIIVSVELLLFAKVDKTLLFTTK